MLPLHTNPAEAYRRVELDARIEGSDGTKLTQICLEAVVHALGQAQASARRDDRAALRNDLSRAGQVILGLERAIDPASPMSQTLREFYGSANLQVRQMTIRFNEDMLVTLRQDFLDVMRAMQTAIQADAGGRAAA
ncbi:flagellar protein FliS [Altererythrobacter sp. GH1-8]|uniref:flagellar protein FliS n=1 Tax=Altererythrobacter sp. GH1-8 TaxID=3349333 RepID=UPI00374DB52B